MAKVALLWWGSFEHGQITVGDLMSVSAVADQLERRGIDFHIVQDRSRYHRPAVRSFEERDVAWRDIEPKDYAVAVFICGPLPTEWKEGRDRLLAFANSRRIAVGGTLTSAGGKSHALAVFHEFFCRDGFDRNWMDLSLACHWPIPERPLRETNRIGLCWRGREAFYSLEGCGDRVISSMTDLMLERRSLKGDTITTAIDDAATDPTFLDRQFGECDLVITTRLHGSLLSLRHATPYIAIDQIVGGRKVLAMGENIGWPHTFSIEKLSLDIIERSFEALRGGAFRDSLVAMRDTAFERSRATLSAVCDSIQAHDSR